MDASELKKRRIAGGLLDKSLHRIDGVGSKETRHNPCRTFGFQLSASLVHQSGLSAKDCYRDNRGKKEPWRMGTGLRKLVLENDIKQRTMDLQSAPAIVNEA
jgi:hypothetical protein